MRGPPAWAGRSRERPARPARPAETDRGHFRVWCDPARLAWFLADLAEQAGATIAEGTDVAAVGRRGGRVTLAVDGGSIEADRVLLATNAARPLLRRLRPRMIPVYDHVIVRGERYISFSEAGLL